MVDTLLTPALLLIPFKLILILRACFILGHSKLEHHSFTGVILICQTPTQVSKADFGSGPLRRAISSQPTIGAMAIDRPIPAGRPESKRDLKARRKLMQTGKIKPSKELQRAAKAEREEVIDLKVEIMTLQNTVLATGDNPEIRKKKCKGCKACKISHHEGQTLCDLARLMQLPGRVEPKAEKELLYTTDRKIYETREEMRHMRVQKRAAQRREEDAGLKSKKIPPRKLLDAVPGLLSTSKKSRSSMPILLDYEGKCWLRHNSNG